MELKTREESPTMATIPAEAQQQQEKVEVVATRPVPIKGKRRNLGRQARKRRKKYLEIETAASAFVAAATSAANLETSVLTTTETTTVLPTDRSYVLEDVKTALSQVDRRDLIRQLGYLPGNALKVVARIEDAFSTEDLQRLFTAATVTTDANDTTTTVCYDSGQTDERTKKMATMIQNMMKEPLVIKLYPLALRDESSSTKRRRKRRREEIEDDSTEATNAGQPQTTPLMEPFPTIYWVTHPLMKALISKLELDRVNVQFEERLEEEEVNQESDPSTKKDVSALESMKRAHTSYGRERRALLSSKDKDYVQGRKWYSDDEPTSATKLPLAKASIPPFSEKCGVAGIRNPKAVKCLHAHAAHYWSGNSDNVVGKWVWERLRSGGSFFQGSIEERTANKRDAIQK